MSIQTRETETAGANLLTGIIILASALLLVAALAIPQPASAPAQTAHSVAAVS